MDCCLVAIHGRFSATTSIFSLKLLSETRPQNVTANDDSDDNTDIKSRLVFFLKLRTENR